MKHPKMLLTVVASAGILLFAGGCGSDDNTQAPRVVPTSEEAPPLTPSGISCQKADAEGFRLAWAPNAEIDFAGYRVYIYDPDPYRDDPYRLTNEASLVPTPLWIYNGPMDGTVWIRITSVDTYGNESARSEPYGVEGGEAPSGETVHDPNAGRDGRGAPIFDPGADPGPGREPASDDPNSDLP